MSDDVTQDAVLRFAKRLGAIAETCEAAAVCVASRAIVAWQYVRRDGTTLVVDRATVRYWAVRDAAAGNGYRLDVKPDAIDAVPGAQVTRGLPHADVLPALAVAPCLAAHSGAIFRTAWGDGRDYPTLGTILHLAGGADDLGRAGILGQAAQVLHGGPKNSSSKVQRTRDAAVKEWRDLTARLDQAREEYVYRGARERRGE
ncbi:hypothetical protein [Streptomyces sp. NPDC059009]|uniref:hypothetical protein n=1 Tax=Streptomyces sp. NPDC059009 TaxID=3346694 RepID=UPI00369B7A59